MKGGVLYEGEILAAEARVVLADAALRDAGSRAERAAAEDEALDAARALVRARGVGLCGRGWLPGLPVVVALDGWLREYADVIGREALDALAAAMNGSTKETRR